MQKKSSKTLENNFTEVIIIKLIERPQYLNFLLRNKDLPLIKVITGVRRSGKSTLFTRYKDYLTTHGVPVECIIYINFEDLAFQDLQEYHVLYRYITERLSPKGKNYIFLDEIQNVPQFEKVINSLFIKDNIDLYISGSNAHFSSPTTSPHCSMDATQKCRCSPFPSENFSPVSPSRCPSRRPMKPTRFFAVLTPPLNGRVWEENIRQKFIVNCSKKTTNYDNSQ